MDIFIGGGGDDLNWLGLGVVRRYATDFASDTGRSVLYIPNARGARLRRAVETAGSNGEPVNLIGHSWGAIDAFHVAVWAARREIAVGNLFTLDPVSGPWRRPAAWSGGAFWLNVSLESSRPDQSDRLTRRRPFAHKPSRLPLASANTNVILDLHHWDVDAMMDLSGARTRLEL